MLHFVLVVKNRPSCLEKQLTFAIINNNFIKNQSQPTSFCGTKYSRMA